MILLQIQPTCIIIAHREMLIQFTIKEMNITLEMQEELQKLPPLTSMGGTQAVTATPIVGEPSRDYAENFIPGQEPLEDGELRVTILGSGVPWVTRAQASSSILIEVGNPERDLLLFDAGSGSLANFASLGLPANKLDKVFLTHLHADHIPDLITLSGCYPKAGRFGPVHVWGPSGSEPALGTEKFIEHLRALCSWEVASSQGAVSIESGQIEATEFDFKKEQVIYEAKGVRITSFPVIHVLDGAVGYRIDFNGLTVVHSGDTCACWPLVEACGNDVDLLIHECLLLPIAPTDGGPAGFIKPQQVAFLNAMHTGPRAMGKVFSLVRPRMGALWHTQLSPKVPAIMFSELRKLYDGPVVQTQDLTVFNVTQEAVIVRQAQVQDAVSPVAGTPSFKPTMGFRPQEPAWFASARMPLDDLVDL